MGKLNNIKAKDLINLLSIKSNKPNSISPSGLTIKSNKCGKYRVLEYLGKNKYGHQVFKIQFFNTGFITTTNIGLMNKGDVKDLLLHDVCGVACLGEDCKELRSSDPELFEVLNKRWHAMIRRCYSTKDSAYHNYGGLGIRVSDNWLNFSIFYREAQLIPGYDRDLLISGELTLDKDKKQQNIPKDKTVYSVDTCCWLTMKDQRMYINCQDVI